MDAHMANITTDLFGNLTSEDRKRIAQAYSDNALSMGKAKDYSPVVQFLTWFRNGAPKYRGYFMEIAQPTKTSDTVYWSTAPNSCGSAWVAPAPMLCSSTTWNTTKSSPAWSPPNRRTSGSDP